MATASHWAALIAVVGAVVARSNVVSRVGRDVLRKVQMPAIRASIAQVGTDAMVVVNVS